MRYFSPASTSAPPNGNVSAPINVGTTAQVKNSGLSVNALAVFGNAILSGTTNYLNFGTVTGTAGYGIRNNTGTMEVKNSAGTWSGFAMPSGAVIAFNLTACPQGWSDYAPAYGSFIRGIDKSGTSIDPDGMRALGNVQDDAFESHYHGFTQAVVGTIISGTLPTTNRIGTYPVDFIVRTTNTGGSETRPKNVALLYYQKD